jgi:diguanylate cyclase (GGDEF)-like protein
MYGVGINRQALSRIVAVTAVSIVISVVTTLLAMTYVFGIDPEATINVSLAFKFGLTIAAIVPALICPITYHKIIMAIGERDRAYAALRSIACTDRLTGLHNRRGFDDAAEVSISADHLDDAIMSVLMIDIDFFKELNDSFGHDFGDAALVQVAAILRNEALEEGFIVGRQGGDEFVALLPGVSGPKAAAIAERIRRACSETLVEHGGKSAYVTVSVGVSTQSQQNSLSQLIGEADGALYCAKQEGRNRVVLYRSVVSLARVA